MDMAFRSTKRNRESTSEIGTKTNITVKVFKNFQMEFIMMAISSKEKDMVKELINLKTKANIPVIGKMIK